jgi:hypothetical protein
MTGLRIVGPDGRGGTKGFSFGYGLWLEKLEKKVRGRVAPRAVMPEPGYKKMQGLKSVPGSA